MGLEGGVPASQKSRHEILGMKQWSRWGQIGRWGKCLSIFPDLEGGQKTRLRASGTGAEEVKHANGFLDPLSCKHMSKESPNVTFFLRTNVFVFFLEVYHLSHLRASFYLLLTIHLI